METSFHLPSTLKQFQQQFPTEEACVDYFFSLKWPSGFSCPQCGHSHAYITNTRRLPLYECLQCHHQTSLIAGTIMSGSRTSLHKWLTAIYGKPFNPYFRNHPQEHYLLAGSSLNHHGEPSYFKLKLVPRMHIKDKLFQRSATIDFIQQHIDSQTTSVEFITGRFSRKRFPPLLVFAAQASKSINNTFHGIGQKYLQSYLDEFCYKANLSLHGLSIFQHLTYLCTVPHAKPSPTPSCP